MMETVNFPIKRESNINNNIDYNHEISLFC